MSDRQQRVAGRLLAAIAAVVCLAACSGTHPAGASTRDAIRTGDPGPEGTHWVTLRSGGHERMFLIHLPAGGGAHPVVLVYHGAEDTAAHTVGETDFQSPGAPADQIVVYMQGYDDTWNEGAGHTPAHQAGIDDVAFTQAALAWVESHADVDLRRIAAAGFSNGALLTELLGCRLAGELDWIVPVEGELPVSVSPGCRPSRPISVLEVHATGDPAIPYRGGRFHGVGGGTTVLSAPASARRWATLDHCAPSPRTTRTFEGDQFLTTDTRCADATTVTLDTVHDDVHEWSYDIGALLAETLVAHPSQRPARRA